MSERTPAWPHAPTHELSLAGTYFITSGTYLKDHYFRGKDRMAVLQRGLLKLAAQFGWQLIYVRATTQYPERYQLSDRR